eukprot:TRINITY_DN12657_c0_g2_i1.p1 TRINITY_DN12657_c0_g2~~TRINITY_DN12657_c0_g2_i1.p1  ORF type:complete len:545 (+),score=98.27 TRINITY_DN12657_c0_g2_i1:172-1806(+)
MSAKFVSFTLALCLTMVSCGAAQKPNVLFIFVDDLRPQFGRSFATPEVLTPHIDAFFLDQGGAAMQHSYVQVAVCGPSRASMLTGRRPDSTHVGVGGDANWCWCARTECKQGELFMTLPTYMRTHGYVTAGTGKVFHPDACAKYPNFTHALGDDPRGWAYGEYTVEANVTQEQWGSIPGPHDAVFGGNMGLSYMESPLSDEEQTDGILATAAITRLANFSRDGIGCVGCEKPFFLALGLHKPHLPHIVPKKYYDLYDPDTVSLAPNKQVPTGFKEENWHADGNGELRSYNLNAGPEMRKDGFGFNQPIADSFARAQRRAYFAAVSFMDAQVGRVLAALQQHDLVENTIVVLWSDHGWHLGDTNSWGKMTNFESAARNTLLWRVPGQRSESQGLNPRMVESVDLFPTVVELTGLPSLESCQGLDQPPTVDCVQGKSYADEFKFKSNAAPAESFAFTQWPFAPWGNQTHLRMGYTVRSSRGYRWTEYVQYDAKSVFRGNWTAEAQDPELYDYNLDKWETNNFAQNASYATVITELKAVLRRQYTSQ